MPLDPQIYELLEHSFGPAYARGLQVSGVSGEVCTFWAL